MDHRSLHDIGTHLVVHNFHVHYTRSDCSTKYLYKLGIHNSFLQIRNYIHIRWVPHIHYGMDNSYRKMSDTLILHNRHCIDKHQEKYNFPSRHTPMICWNWREFHYKLGIHNLIQCNPSCRCTCLVSSKYHVHYNWMGYWMEFLYIQSPLEYNGVKFQFLESIFSKSTENQGMPVTRL